MVKRAITREDFESGKLSPLDVEAYMTGLRPDGTYGKSPKINVDLARINYPGLFGQDNYVSSISTGPKKQESSRGYVPRTREQMSRDGVWD